LTRLQGAVFIYSSNFQIFRFLRRVRRVTRDMCVMWSRDTCCQLIHAHVYVHYLYRIFEYLKIQWNTLLKINNLRIFRRIFRGHPPEYSNMHFTSYDMWSECVPIWSTWTVALGCVIEVQSSDSWLSGMVQAVNRLGLYDRPHHREVGALVRCEHRVVRCV
jgi:hypothetical protein